MLRVPVSVHRFLGVRGNRLARVGIICADFRRSVPAALCAIVQTSLRELGQLHDSQGRRAGCRPSQGACGMPMSPHAAVDIAGVRPVEPDPSHRRVTDTTEGSDMTHTPDALARGSLAELASFQGRPRLSRLLEPHARRPGRAAGQARRESIHTESVTYVFGIFCKPCTR